MDSRLLGGPGHHLSIARVFIVVYVMHDVAVVFSKSLLAMEVHTILIVEELLQCHLLDLEGKKDDVVDVATYVCGSSTSSFTLSAYMLPKS